MNSFALPAGLLLHQRYAIQSQLGQGGFGITYLALDTLLQQEICIKELFVTGFSTRNEDMSVVSPPLRGKSFQNFIARFVDEARSLAQFKHPNIVRVLDVFQANQTAYMVMDYVKGETMSEKINREGIPNDLTAKDFFSQLLDAVEKIHQKGMLHRDIKPGNILITTENKLVLIDFGSAREFVEGKAITETAMISRGYAPFEQYSSRAHRGPFTDIYALGATLYFMVTGKVPVEAIDRDTVHLVPPREVNAEVSGSLSAVVMKAMEMKTKNRFQSIAALRNALPVIFLSKNKEAKESKEAQTVRQPTGAKQEERYPVPFWQQKLTLIAIGAVIFLGLGLIIFNPNFSVKPNESGEKNEQDTVNVLPGIVPQDSIRSKESSQGDKEGGNPKKNPSSNSEQIPGGTGGKISSEQVQSQEFIVAGNQRWMKKNLDVAQFRNGDPIFEAKSVEEWQKAALNKTPAWCYVENKPGKGKLYNWFAVADPRGLAPKGWHIPSDQEWRQLVNFFGGSKKAAQELKKESGFDARLSGFRDPNGEFEKNHLTGRWWSKTPKTGEEYAYGQRIKVINEISSEEFSKGYGFSVRAIKD